MKLKDFRREMASYRLAADQEGESFKDPYVTLEHLRTLYKKFDSAEKQMADQVFAEWALSEDEAIRFDALTLIDDFEIGAAVPALRELATRLTSSSASSAPYGLKKIQRIITQLESW
jgi:hypothetical protein